MLPHFLQTHRVVLFDHVGAGDSDVLESCELLDLDNVTLVSHSFSGMMSLAAAATDPGRLGRLMLLASSPSYMDYPMTATLVDLMPLISLDANYLV